MNDTHSTRASREIKLLQALATGDERAYDYFFHKFYPVLLLFSKRFVVDQSIAEEVVQSVFFKVWEKRGDFKTVDALKAFLYIATKNGSFNWMSKNKNRAKYQEAYANLNDQTELPIIHEIIRSEVWSTLSGAIDTLPEQCGKIIRMLFEDDKTPKEIAEELGISVSTVNSQKARGLGLLKDRLSGSNYDALLLAIALFPALSA